MIFQSCSDGSSWVESELRPEFLYYDLREFFSDLGLGERKKKKRSENDQLTGHFQSFFVLIFSELFCVFFFQLFFQLLYIYFFNISKKNSKTSKVNQQSALNI